MYHAGSATKSQKAKASPASKAPTVELAAAADKAAELPTGSKRQKQAKQAALIQTGADEEVSPCGAPWYHVCVIDAVLQVFSAVLRGW